MSIHDQELSKALDALWSSDDPLPQELPLFLHIAGVSRRKSMPCRGKAGRRWGQYQPAKPAYTLVSMCGRGERIGDFLNYVQAKGKKPKVEWCRACRVAWDEGEAAGKLLPLYVELKVWAWYTGPYGFATTTESKKRRRLTQLMERHADTVKRASRARELERRAARDERMRKKARSA